MFVASPELRLFKFVAFVFVFHRPLCFLNYSPTHPSKNERKNGDGGGAFCRTKLAIVFLMASSVHADLEKTLWKNPKLLNRQWQDPSLGRAIMLQKRDRDQFV